ncbi:GntR family transcriptional regulator [Martelella alba]|uniref:GntR family transcriptional regulator n=1 Tax=Martelella alba TaxID=2590451 RepID=A0A506UEP4_9HYPH|nr:GntR family transcriptional regulator [Martelella alba]TPW32470.1 GntR family transcriptional regulator [Martelella alba]
MNRIIQPLDLVGEGPLYLRLKRALSDAVSSGRLDSGAALPPERDLAEDAGVSRVTVRRAIEELTQEGLLMRRHGSGTFVARPVERIQQPLSRLTSFTEDMLSRGLTPHSRWLERGLYSPTTEEVMALGLSPGSRVARLTRIRLADDMPMAIERTSLPEDILANPEAVEHSLYETLSARGVRPVRAIQRISAVVLKPEQTALLDLPEGAPALSVQRIAYNETGRVIEATQAHYRSDVYDLIAELTLDNV